MATTVDHSTGKSQIEYRITDHVVTLADILSDRAEQARTDSLIWLKVENG